MVDLSTITYRHYATCGGFNVSYIDNASREGGGAFERKLKRWVGPLVRDAMTITETETFLGRKDDEFNYFCRFSTEYSTTVQGVIDGVIL